MAFTKKLLKHPATQMMLGFLLASYIRLVYFTSRKIRCIEEGAVPYMRGERNVIFAFWHGRMMMLPAFNPRQRHTRVLISLHRDGRLISRVISHFNQSTISGSSSKGGKEAVSEILRALEAGDNISITPDGPRGPAQVAARGIVTLAKLSGKPVLPVCFSSTRVTRFNSWDSFMLALPFGRIVFCVGEPIMLSADADDAAEEAARLHIEREMNMLVKKADEATHG